MAAAFCLPAASWAEPASAKAALEEASGAGRYLCLVFYEAQDETLTALVKTVEDVTTTAPAKPTIHKSQISNPAEAEVAGKYGVRAGGRLPVLLVVAPNGVVTGGFPKTVRPEQLQACLSLSGLALDVLKPLQQRKIVLLSLQNGTTKFNEESTKAVREFADDPQFKTMVAVIKADPTTESNREFLKQCKLSEKIDEATVLFLVPPASLVKTFSGNITKTNLMTALAACTAGSGCCGSK